MVTKTDQLVPLQLSMQETRQTFLELSLDGTQDLRRWEDKIFVLLFLLDVAVIGSAALTKYLWY